MKAFGWKGEKGNLCYTYFNHIIVLLKHSVKLFAFLINSSKTVSSQPTLDRHLRACTDLDKLHSILKVCEKLNILASTDLIEIKFEELITEKILNKKLNELQSAIKTEVQNEVDTVYQN